MSHDFSQLMDAETRKIFEQLVEEDRPGTRTQFAHAMLWMMDTPGAWDTAMELSPEAPQTDDEMLLLINRTRLRMQN